MSPATTARTKTPPVLSASNLRFQFHRLLNRPELVLGAICLSVLGGLVLVPLLEILRDSLSYQGYDLAYRPEAEVGAFTLFHFERVFTGPLSRALLIEPLLNSVGVSACVTLIGVTIGTGLAWLRVRTDVPFKGFFGTMTVIPYMMPSWVLALARLSLFKNDRIGLTFIRILGTFGTPALLGLPVRFFTFSTLIYASLNTRNSGNAYVLALVLIALAISFIWINSRVIGIRKSFVTLLGKGFRQMTITLGAWRWPATLVIAAFLSVTVALPLLILLWDSLVVTPGDYTWSGLTTHFWVRQGDADLAYGEPGVVHSPGILSALWNSCRLGVSAAVCNVALGLLVGYAAVRGQGTFPSQWLEGVAFAPYIFPSIALGAIYIGMFSTPWGPIPALYGTFAILVLITVVKNLPFTSRTGIAAMLQIDKSLEEAARVQGIGWGRRILQIIVPMSVSGLVAGMLLTFITTMRELSLIILLLSPANMVLTGVIFDYQEQDMTQHSGAVTLLLVAIIVGVNVLVRLLSGGAGLAGLKHG